MFRDSELASIYKFRHFIFLTILREIKIKYRRSYLGMLWIFVAPLSQILIYFVIFSHFMGARIDTQANQYGYIIYLCIGILLWSYFSELLTRLTNFYITYSDIIKKVSVPKIVFPAIILGSSLFNLFIIGIIFFIFCFIVNFIDLTFLLKFFFSVLMISFLALSVGFLLSTINVFVRDTSNIVQTLLQFSFWLTPIVYDIQSVPQAFRFLIYLNPMAHCIKIAQSNFLQNQSFDYLNIIYPVFFSFVFFLLALKINNNLAHKIADEL